MQVRGATRAAVLRPATADLLRDFLQFRHRFRNLYGFELSWPLMKPLVSDLRGALEQFDADLGYFLTR